MKFFVRILFVIATIFYLGVILFRVHYLKIIFISLPIFLLLISYFLEVKDKSTIVVITFLISIIANIFSTVNDFYLISMILFLIESVCFSLILSKNHQYKKYSYYSIYIVLIFLFIFSALFILIFSDIEDKLVFFASLCYGFTSFLLCGLAFVLFLNKMNKLSLFIFLGFFIKIVSDIIHSLLFLNTTSSQLNFLSDLFYLISYVVIYKCLIYRVKLARGNSFIVALK